jgi:tetratricopeptide (TPR) repeat protein
MTYEKAEEAEESQRLEEAKRHYNLGYDAFELELYEIAIDEYTTAIKLNPSYAKAYTNRGLAYHKLKRHAEATADLKEAARLGSTVARDDLLKKSRTNKILLGTVTAIVLLIIISAWQNHNEKINREEIQRQQVIAAEQARIKAEQEQAAFQEEYMRERRKKMIHDMVYRPRGILGHNSEPATKQDVEDAIMTRPHSVSSLDDTDIKRIARKEAQSAIQNDRMMHGND